jgi:hypothetical protein
MSRDATHRYWLFMYSMASPHYRDIKRRRYPFPRASALSRNRKLIYLIAR